MIEDYDNKTTQTKGKLVFSEFKKVRGFARRFTGRRLPATKNVFLFFSYVRI